MNWPDAQGGAVNNAKWVLLVEDEEVLRESMARAVRKLKDVDVVQAGSVDEACRQLDERLPDLVISDIDMPQRSGIELVGELRSRGASCPLVYISAYVKSYLASIPRHANVEVHEKPMSISTLRELVVDKLGGADTRSRSTLPFGAADFLQLAAMGRRSVTVRSTGRGGEGAIVVVDGTPWAAYDELGEGLEAFSRLAFAPYANCKAVTDEAARPQNLQGTLEALLLDAARRDDEAAQQSPGGDDDEPALFDTIEEPPPVATSDHTLAPPSGSLLAFQAPQAEFASASQVEAVSVDEQRLPVVEVAAGADFDAHWEAGVNALLDKDYVAAKSAFEAAAVLRPDDARVRANLARLDDVMQTRSSNASPE